MQSSKWKQDIDEAIVGTCVQVIEEPLTYFSEADVQQLLAERLRRIPSVGKAYWTSVRKGMGSKSFYRTPALHREYGGGGGRRIDIVIFDPDDIRNIDQVNLTMGADYLTPAYAFELGTEKTSDTAAHFIGDFEKLKNVREAGYLIHFFKDSTQAQTGTRSRDLTEAKIERIFKAVFNKATLVGIPKIKILAILLRTYRNQAKMRGKCEIFNGTEWVKTNINRPETLRAAIRAELA